MEVTLQMYIFEWKGTASEATLVALLTAKTKTLNRLRMIDPEFDESQAVGRLLAYSSGNN